MLKTTNTIKRLSSRSLGIAALALSLTAASVAASAETVKIPLGQQGQAWNVETPRHGLSKAAVRASFGEPMMSEGPVGEPPIYTWEYEQFNVYFEGDYVIHAVVKKQAMPAQTSPADESDSM